MKIIKLTTNKMVINTGSSTMKKSLSAPELINTLTLIINSRQCLDI
jgi:hypothetical protein